MSKSNQKPDYYNTVMPYLILKDALAFIEFASTVFGAEKKAQYPDENGRVMHAEIVIGDSAIMIGESNEEWPVQTAGLYINVNLADEVYQKALDSGAKNVMEPSDQEYGRTCGVKDPQGVTWWITSELR
jgi:PhnB protein